MGGVGSSGPAPLFIGHLLSPRIDEDETGDKESENAYTSRISAINGIRAMAGRPAFGRQHLRLRHAHSHAPRAYKTTPFDMHTDRIGLSDGRIRVRFSAFVADGPNADNHRTAMARTGFQKAPSACANYTAFSRSRRFVEIYGMGQR